MALAHVEPVEQTQREAVVHLGSSDEVLTVLTGLIGSLPLDLGANATGEVDLWIVCDDDGTRRISVLQCNKTRCRARPSLPLNLVVTPITPGERRVLSYLPTHLNAAAIASELNLSRHTVKSHMASIYRKLDVTSRDAAVRRAGELGVFGSCSESPYRRRPRLMRMARRSGLAASGDD